VGSSRGRIDDREDAEGRIIVVTDITMVKMQDEAVSSKVSTPCNQKSVEFGLEVALSTRRSASTRTCHLASWQRIYQGQARKLKVKFFQSRSLLSSFVD
jgi:hypothetical protein